jgi:hypothetical protein
LDPEVRIAVEQSRLRGAARTLATLGIDRPGPAVQALVRGWVAFVDQLVADWLRAPSFSEADLIRVLCGNLADLLTAAVPFEPETIAQVSLPALRD